MNKEQNFANHAQYVPMFHIVLFAIVLAINVLAFINLFTAFSCQTGILLAILLALMAISMLISFFMMRLFAVRVQDRAIRAEENLRFFTLTGKLFDSRLTISQIIALRFAPNNEFVELAEKALNENLSNKEIKQAIRHWKADHHRV